MINNLHSQSIFDPRKYPNQKTHESAGFLVWVLPEVQNWFWKQFFKQVLYNHYSNFLCGAFRLKNGVSQNWFPIVFSKFDLTGKRFFFGEKKSEKAKHPEICLIFGGNMPKFQIKWCPLTPPPPYRASNLFQRISHSLLLNLENQTTPLI